MQTTALLAGVENHRVGQVAGDGGLAKIVRTFHARFGSVKMGAGQTPRQRIAYVRREGQHADDAGDVEATAGDKEKVLDTADRLEAGARIKRGPTADRLLATQVIELPAESTPEQRAKCAQAFVDDWRERGHPAIATVHVHGEERGQPHLHVEIAARPMGADGEVDRSVRLWRGKPTIYAERQKVADLVNRTCEPDPPYHPGGFRDIGREGDTPKKRIPARPFREARAEIRAAPEKAAGIKAEMYAASRTERAQVREAHEKRTEQINEFKAMGEWPPVSERVRLEKRGDDWWRYYNNRVAAETARAAERDEQRERAEKAEASVAALTGEKQEAETRADTAEAEREGLRGEVRQLQELNKRQTKYVTDWHGEREVDLPDLATVEGQAAAWANMRAWKAEALKKAVAAAAAKEAAEQALADERALADKRIAAAVRLALEAERQEQNRDGRGTGEAGGVDRRPDQGADRPGTEARRGGDAEDHGAGRAERPRAVGDRPEGDDGREQTGGVGQPASAGGPHAVDGNVGGDRGADSPAPRGPGGVESRVVAAPGRGDAGGLAREHGLVEEPGAVERHRDRRGDDDGADVGGDRGDDWNWLLEVGGAAGAPEPGRPVVAEPPPDVVVSGGGEEQQKAAEPPPPARPWKDLSDDELVNHWDGASRRRRRASAPDEQKADARQKIVELHAEAKHRNTTLKTLDARKQQREGRGGGMEM